MIRVIRKKGESSEDLIRRFKNKCNHADIKKEFKERQAYIPPSKRRRAKHLSAMRRR